MLRWSEVLVFVTNSQCLGPYKLNETEEDREIADSSIRNVTSEVTVESPQ